ncbi:MAG: L-aspartate oxidase [Gulosibacter sp.]|uniref:L-aspartate oxidase n=1 Tax=Gulosibacter sp. TaxID=2817531 RepID=UPI003F9154BE
MTSRVLVVGGGIAGLTTAIKARAAGFEVLLVCKHELGDCSTIRAQGGIAGAVFPDDSVAAHVADTLLAGAGHADPDAVQALCEGGAESIHDLARQGVVFDTDANGQWSRGLEGAHSIARIVHAGGDATGAHIHAALVSVARRQGVRILEHRMLREVILRDGFVVGGEFIAASPQGADAPRANPAGTEVIEADAVVLATGGFGGLYPFTTNPESATGDGIVVAARAGAAVADLEFMQFHPTVLAVGEPFLISEAVRGEGAVLLDADGHRFMPDVDPRGELASRDIVARAIALRSPSNLAADGMSRRGVTLDATRLGKTDLARRFPTIDAAVRARGLDWSREPIPVRPGAHFAMGGVATDLWGRTTLPGLYAVGEVACTGVHGANRLASNSLLEGAVFGARVARAIAADASSRAAASGTSIASATGAVPYVEATPFTDALPFTRAALQTLMWDHVGLFRTAEGLAHAAAR